MSFPPQTAGQGGYVKQKHLILKFNIPMLHPSYFAHNRTKDQRLCFTGFVFPIGSKVGSQVRMYHKCHSNNNKKSRIDWQKCDCIGGSLVDQTGSVQSQEHSLAKC